MARAWNSLNSNLPSVISNLEIQIKYWINLYYSLWIWNFSFKLNVCHLEAENHLEVDKKEFKHKYLFNLNGKSRDHNWYVWI